MRIAHRLVSACLVFAASAAAAATFDFDQVYNSLSAVRSIRDVAISPDGTRVAWAQPGIYIADLKNGGEPRRLAYGRDLAWSPDSRRLAYLADDSNGVSQLYVTGADGGDARKLTDLTGYLAEPRWSPDGRTIAILFTENAPRAAGPLQPVTPESGVVGAKIYNQRIATVDAASGAVMQVSPADLYVYEYDWSPDGKQFAATAAPGPGDNNWYIAQLYTLEVRGGRMKSILKPSMQIADPRWSPDGTSIAFIGGLMSDEGATGGDVYLIPSAGGEPRNLTPRMNASASTLHWLTNEKLLFAGYTDGETGFAEINITSGSLDFRWRGPGMASLSGWLPSASFAHDGKTTALVRHSFNAPPEVWAGHLGNWRQISKLNDGIKPEWGEARSIHWTSEGRAVQGWLLYPKGYDASKRWPMVVEVHGGPSSMEGSSWPGASAPAILSAAGYFVLMPNPRGSYGMGEEFTRANVRDFGYGDFRDILNGVDEVVRTLPVDNNRVGITGWSYGGYMTMWSVTQTRRFRAAMAGAGLSNWQSYYGQNQIDQWMIPFFGASVYDDPAVYARSSPITFIKNVKTPTLIVVGDRDAECPAPQSWEFWHALKTLGVTTEFVIYPNEGHGISDPVHRRDIAKRAVEWFDRHMN